MDCILFPTSKTVFDRLDWLLSSVGTFEIVYEKVVNAPKQRYPFRRHTLGGIDFLHMTFRNRISNNISRSCTVPYRIPGDLYDVFKKTLRMIFFQYIKTVFSAPGKHYKAVFQTVTQHAQMYRKFCNVRVP